MVSKIMKILRFLAALFALTLSGTAQLVDYRGLGTNGFYTNGFIVNSKYWTNQSGQYRYQPGTGPVNTGGAPGPAFTIRKDGSLFVGTNVTQDINLADYTTLYLPWAITMTKSNEPVTLRSIYTVADDESYGFYSSGGLNLSGNKDAGSSQVFVTSHLTNGSSTAAYLISDPSGAPSWLFKGQSNGVDTIRIRYDGSIYHGRNVGQDADFNEIAYGPNASAYPLYATSLIDSNDPGAINIFIQTYDNLSPGPTYGSSIDLVEKGQRDSGNARVIISSFLTNGASTTVNIQADPSGNRTSGRIFYALTNSDYVFTVDKKGNLAVINKVLYEWPGTNGGSSQVLTTDGGSPQQLYWSTPSSGGITNSGVGPGTVNFIPKFITSTNITDSRVHQVETNQWNWNVRTNYAANTNSWTNRFYAEFTSTNNFQGADFVINPPTLGLYNGIFPIRGSANTNAQNKFRIWDSWDINGVGTNTVDGTGHFLPAIDALEDVGNGSKRVRDYFGSRYVIVTPLSSAAQFTFAAGGGGVGGTTDGTMLQFFRDTGITAAFNKANGAFTFDLAGNGIGFGSGISNVISGLTGSGLAGLVMMSPGTNSATVTPGTHGIIGVMATGADKSGGDLRLVGGSSTGVGTNGSVRIQTSEPALSTSSSLNNNFYDRLYVCAKPKVLTTNSATIVFNVTIPTADRMLGGEVTATTKISDGVDQASVRERFAFTAIRKGSTVTTAISASAPMATLATGSAVLTTTWTAVANAQSVDIKCNAVTSGILSTNTFTRWSVELDSDAVPVISP